MSGDDHEVYDNSEETHLIRQAIHDPTAFQRLYELYFRRVYSYVAAKLTAPQDAEDLVAEVFLQVVKGLPRLNNRHDLSFAAWIFTIARNSVADFYRRRRPLDEAALSHTLPTTYEFDDSLIEQERAAELRMLLNTLSERRREVLMLKYFSGLRNLEIAQVLSLDERTVASHLSRGLKDLYDAYQQKQMTNEGTTYDDLS
jgi:RNA polymerase sigma factor (sigma-70 family)